jgi:para-nitrobenzyl esterase
LIERKAGALRRDCRQDRIPMTDSCSEFPMRRRSLLVGAAGLAAASALPAWAAAAENCTVEVEQGRLRGLRRMGCDAYFGVPYAGRVSGNNRFLAAPKAESWAGMRDATRPGPPSIQPSRLIIGFSEPDQSEDCLVLNIWAPSAPGRNRPVMVYNHGGGFISGSAAAALQDGSNLARENDVIVVATNHRLGLLGFLYLDRVAGPDFAGSGNRGVQDIVTALAWIRHNISAFGGDPGNVMIFGESGGGLKTSALYAMPQAAPYFHKASIESGPGVRLIDADEADATTRKILGLLGLAPRAWRRLLDIPASKLLEMQLAVAPGMAAKGGLIAGGYSGPLSGVAGNFGAVRDGYLLPNHPFDPVAPDISRDKPLLVGCNEDEQMFFSLVTGDTKAWLLDDASLRARLQERFGARAGTVEAAYRAARPTASPSDLYFAVGSALFLGLGSERIAERKAAQNGARVYRYEFAFDQGEPIPGTSSRMGAMHALDIAFKFNNMETKSPLPLRDDPPLAGRRKERYGVGRAMSGLWAGFARTGRPSATGVPEWPAFTLKDRACMVIDAQCHVEKDLNRAERLFWANEFPAVPDASG